MSKKHQHHQNGKAPRRNTLSLCMIARDEEELIGACLESLMLDGQPIWDELVVGLDTRSSDRTREIVEAYGAKVVEIQWPVDDNLRDFATARNAVEEAATGDYVYVQDCDEMLVKGHEAILEIVREGKLKSVRPIIVFTRDEYGKKQVAYPRQDTLHKRGAVKWYGKLHEWTDGHLGDVRTDIEVEQMVRPQGDRPHGDTFQMLRQNFSLEMPWQERHMFYLAREHAGAPVPEGSEVNGHEQEAIALVEKLLKSSPLTSAIQRSHACVIAAECCTRLGDSPEAHDWYVKAIHEWAAWAEPYYALGVFTYQIAMEQRKADAPNDVVHALFNEAAGWLLASTVHEPPSYFVDLTIYSWRRYQALAISLAQIGRLTEADIWMQRAIASEPASEELRAQRRVILDAMPKPEEVSAP